MKFYVYKIKPEILKFVVVVVFRLVVCLYFLLLLLLLLLLLCPFLVDSGKMFSLVYSP